MATTIRSRALAEQVERWPGSGRNAVGRLGGKGSEQVVVMAHVDAERDRPGAIDNASGGVTLLLLAELLAVHIGHLGINLVAMNSEDDYANPGERPWLEHNTSQAGEITLGVNVDGAGYRVGRAAYSLSNCPADIASGIEESFATFPGLIPGAPYPVAPAQPTPTAPG